MTAQESKQSDLCMTPRIKHIGNYEPLLSRVQKHQSQDPKLVLDRAGALQCGADICPVYHLGQSQILSFWGPDDFIRRSRMLVGFMWGRWYLPLPRQHDIISVGGHPIKGHALATLILQVLQLLEWSCARIRTVSIVYLAGGVLLQQMSNVFAAIALVFNLP